MIRRKEKGSKAERELVTMFWNAGWAAIRVAGSGLTKKPNPDVIAGNGIRRIAVECKTTKQIRKYLTREDVNQLIEFSRKFGAEPWFGIRINNMKWYFIGVEGQALSKILFRFGKAFHTYIIQGYIGECLRRGAETINGFLQNFVSLTSPCL